MNALQKIKVMNVWSYLVDSKMFDGVRYDLFLPINRGGPGAIRVTDEESDNVVSIGLYRDAESQFRELIDRVRPTL